MKFLVFLLCLPTVLVASGWAKTLLPLEDCWAYDLVWNPNNNQVYVSLCDSSCVAVIDCNTDSVVAMIRVGMAPCVIGVLECVNKVYTISDETGALYIIDCATNTLQSCMSLPRYGVAMAFSETSSRVFIACPESRCVAVVDGATNRPLPRIDSNWADQLAWLPATDRLLIVDNDSLRVADCATGEFVCSWWYEIFVAAAIDPADGCLSVLDEISLTRYSAGGDSLLWQVSTPYNGVALGLTTRPNHALVGQGRGRVARYDLADGSMVREQPGCDVVAFGNDGIGGVTFWLNIARFDQVEVRDAATDSLIDSVRIVMAEEPALAWSETSRKLYVVDEGFPEGVAILRDTTTGVGEGSLTLNASRGKPEPTIVRGVLRLRPSAYGLRQDIALLDAGGRKVLDLKAGDNDVSRLAPGVYFVRGVRPGARVEGGAAKVVITR
ncbi:MAG: hypothetical protein R6X13_02015 [bacterium]